MDELMFEVEMEDGVTPEMFGVVFDHVVSCVQTLCAGLKDIRDVHGGRVRARVFGRRGAEPGQAWLQGIVQVVHSGVQVQAHLCLDGTPGLMMGALEQASQPPQWVVHTNRHARLEATPSVSNVAIELFYLQAVAEADHPVHGPGYAAMAKALAPLRPRFSDPAALVGGAA